MFRLLLYGSAVSMGWIGPWKDMTVQSSPSSPSPSPTPAGKATPGLSKENVRNMTKQGSAQKECEVCVYLTVKKLSFGYLGSECITKVFKLCGNVCFLYRLSHNLQGMFKSRKHPQGMKPQIMSTSNYISTGVKCPPGAFLTPKGPI